MALVDAGFDRLVERVERIIGEFAGPAHIGKFDLALDDTLRLDQVGCVLPGTETIEHALDQNPALSGQTPGVQFDADLAAGDPLFLQHRLDVMGRIGPAPVDPDPHILDNRRESRLFLVGGAGDERHRTVGEQHQTLKQRITAGVVAGQIEHAFLFEEQQSVQPTLCHQRT